MPEIKHQFTGGKMNKDLDERLIPRGEYRDAMNIQVSTSEESDVGTVQNILGNKEILGHVIPELEEHCVATISDEANDVGYYFIASSNTLTEWDNTFETCEDLNSYYDLQRDMIVKFDGVTTTPIFVDPYLKTCFATLNYTSFDPGETALIFNTMCQGNPYSIERNDIITKIETIDSVFDNLNIRLGSFSTDNLNFALVQADIPSDIQDAFDAGYDGPMRFTFGGKDHRVLNFDKDKLITGINIIDDMLFWTDNHSEPKKINIGRSMQGTSKTSGGDYLLSTKLIVKSEDAHYSPSTLYGNWRADAVACKEEHITVIKKSPNTVLWVDAIDATKLTTGFTSEDANRVNIGSFGSSSTNQNPSVNGLYDLFLAKNYGPSLANDDILVFNEASLLVPSSSNYQCKVVLNSFNSTQKTWEVTILEIDPGFNVSDNYNWSEIFKPGEDAFKEKFPRFSYRYKYEDGEYSCFAPFTSPVFTPGEFSYEPKKAYNLGMENTIRKVAIKGYKNNIPLDVVQVDILYKESNSALVYLIDSIKPNPNPLNPAPNSSIFWEDEGSYTFNMPTSYGSNYSQSSKGYVVTPNINKGVLPSNQLLRSWDNVPRLALAQEITANRLVYANYIQNYNIPYTPLFTAELENLALFPGSKRSLKSLRSYSLGISYLDKFNRESPVFASEKSEIKIPIANSKDLNKVKITSPGITPEWATHCKIYVKDTSNEYYNLAMDRFYDAKDGNVWISFPSSDRNKITDETFLILKKEQEGSTAVTEKNRYKILAIESEAPEFIKTRLMPVGQSVGSPEDIFTDNANLPRLNTKRFRLDYDVWNFTEIPFGDLEKPLAARFSILGGLVSTYYDVTSASAFIDAAGVALYYDVRLSTGIKETWVNNTNPASVQAVDVLADGLAVQVFRKITENKPEFDGRFFVKIEKDPLIETNIIAPLTLEANLEQVLGVILPFLFFDQSDASIPAGTIGTTQSHWELDRIAEFANKKSGWFIDNTYSAGYYENAELNEMGMLYLDGFGKGPNTMYYATQGNPGHLGALLNAYNNPTYDSAPSVEYNFLVPFRDGPGARWTGNSGLRNTRETIYNDLTGNTPPNYENKNAFSKGNGIYTETIGGVERYFIDLAFTGIGDSLYNPNFNSWGWANRAGLGIAAENDSSGTTAIMGGAPISGHSGPGLNFNPNFSFYFDTSNTVNSARAEIIGGYGINVSDWQGFNWPVGFVGPAPNIPLQDSLNLYGKVSRMHYDPSAAQNEHQLDYWRVGSNLNIANADQADIVQNIFQGNKFRFKHPDPAQQDDVIYEILNDPQFTCYVNHTNSYVCQRAWNDWGLTNVIIPMRDGNFVEEGGDNHWGGPWADGYITPTYGGTDGPSYASDDLDDFVEDFIKPMGLPSNRRIRYKIEIDKNPLTHAGAFNPIDSTAGNGGANFNTLGEIQFLTLQQGGGEEGALQSNNPAVWETEQKADNDLDIYYEVGDVFPLEINNDTNYDFAPIGTTFKAGGYIATTGAGVYTILEWSDNRCRVDELFLTNYDTAWYEANPQIIGFTRPNGSIVRGQMLGIANPIGSTIDAVGNDVSSSHWIIIDKDISKLPITLSWYNCYSFGNGVESDRIRDDFNQVKIDKGAKASSTLDEYKEERRKTGLIYSGLYNSNSGLNNLNQFIQAEKITKDINPVYGSIQKLHARDTDLVTLCEDKCLRILSSKDALFNADGNQQLIATANVLGQTIPFSGEFGISKNPESFASESYRVYFTDKVRGTVMRLSKDGLTPISNHGMKNWFKDNLKLSNKLIGSYDDKKDEYNITLKQSYNSPVEAEIESGPYYSSGIYSDDWVLDDGGAAGA